MTCPNSTHELTRYQTRIIVHMDMDAFYAAVEQRDHPEYKGKPVIVGADPKEGRGRGVVSTASYEARAFGVHSAQPISDAFRRCPHGVFLPVRGKQYVTVSNQIMELLAEYSPIIEPISLDEAFLDLSGMQRLQGSPERVAEEIRKRVFETIGLTCSIGVGPNRLVAKIASDYQKPDGLTIVRADQVHDFLSPLPVRRIWGVGRVAEAKLKTLGMHHVRDVRRMTPQSLESCFGAWGVQLWRYAHGWDDSPVGHEVKTKSLSNELTFEQDVHDPEYLEHALLQLSESVGFRLRSHGLSCKTLFIKLRFADFTTRVRNRTFQSRIHHGSEIYQEALCLLRLIDLVQPVRLIGVGCAQLLPSDQGQGDLFEETAVISKVSKAMDAIKHKYGERMIQRGVF